VTSTTTCALLPRILRFRSYPKPPMIDRTEQRCARADGEDPRY
jgi:hypothetical protein